MRIFCIPDKEKFLNLVEKSYGDILNLLKIFHHFEILISVNAHLRMIR